MKATPSGRQYWAHTASQPRTSGSGSTSSPTGSAGWGSPKATEGMGRYSQVNGKRYPGLWLQAESAGWPSPMTVNTSSDKAEHGRPTSGPHRGGPSFGLEDVAKLTSWPTPSANNFEQEDQEALERRRQECKERKNNGNGFGLTLGNAARMASWPAAEPTSWSTPAAHDAKGTDYRRYSEDGIADGRSCALQDPAQLASWPTPRAEERDQHNSADSYVALSKAVRLTSWATPRSTEAGHSTGSPDRAEGYRGRLEDQVFLAGRPTPAAGDDDKTVEPARLTASGRMLTGSSAGTENGGQLNPEHSRWLMGYPAGWTSSAATATPSSRKLRKRS